MECRIGRDSQNIAEYNRSGRPTYMIALCAEGWIFISVTYKK